MRSKKRIRIKIIICAVCLVIIAGAITLAALLSNGSLKTVKPAQSLGGKYLFAYFTGDGEEDEKIRFATSEDGCNYTALNNGEPVIGQTLGTLGARDPFIIRARDGYFYIIAADMKMQNGEDSNHSFVTWRSSDLVTWSEESLIELRNFAGFESCNRAWSPKAIWDESAGKYLVYFVASTLSGGNETPQVYYCHTTSFKKFTAPKPLFSLQDGSISSAEIFFNSVDGKYYLIIENRETGRLFSVSGSSLTGPFSSEANPVIKKKNINLLTSLNITGTNAFVLAVTNDKKDKSFAVQTEDFTSFTFLKSSAFSFPAGASGGSVLQITDYEYSMLEAAYGYDIEDSSRLITPFSTTEEASE